MTSNRVRPSEKTISWSSNPGLENAATSQSSLFHSKCLRVSPSPGTQMPGRGSCGRLWNCVFLLPSTGLGTDLGRNTGSMTVKGCTTRLRRLGGLLSPWDILPWELWPFSWPRPPCPGRDQDSGPSQTSLRPSCKFTVKTGCLCPCLTASARTL